MNIKPYRKEQAREFLIQHALNEIRDNSDFNTFHRRAFCVITKHGFQLETKEEGLLIGDEWSNPACKDVLVKKVERFLDKHIR